MGDACSEVCERSDAWDADCREDVDTHRPRGSLALGANATRR